MTTSSGTSNPLYQMIKEPLEEIRKQISDLVECAYKIELLEKLAIVRPDIDTVTARIKRANDFDSLLHSIMLAELEIEQMYQILSEQLTEKQTLYEELEIKYEEFYKKLLASSNQLIQVDKDYVEREYIEKLNKLLNEINTIYDLLSGKIEILNIKIKEIDMQINTLDKEIEKDTQQLMEVIDAMCNKGDSSPEIEKLIINVPVFNEKGEAVIKTEENQETIELEFTFDKNLDKAVLKDLLQGAIQTGQLNKDDLLNQLTHHISNSASRQIQPHLIHLDRPKKEVFDFILKIPGIDRFIKNHAQNTFARLGRSPLFSDFLTGVKELKRIEMEKECLSKETHALIEQRDACIAHAEKLKKHRDEMSVKADINLDTLQKAIQTAQLLASNSPKSKTLSQSSILDSVNNINNTQLTTEEKPIIPKRRPRS